MRISLLMILFSAAAFAQSKGQIVIKQLLLDHSRVVVRFTGSLQPGADLVANFKNGSQCSLKVSAVRGAYADIDTSSCEFASNLVVGQRLERSLAVENFEPVPHPAPSVDPIKPAEGKKVTSQGGYKRNLTDIQYLPEPRKFIASLGYSNTTTTVSLVNGSSQLVTDSNETAGSVNALFAAGITKQLALGVGLGWVPSDSTQDTYGPGSTLNGQNQTFVSTGLQDPYFGFQYRMVEQNPGPLTLDLYLSYSPNMITSKSATAQTNGTSARGGDLTKATLALDRKGKGYEFSFQYENDLYGPAASSETFFGSEKTTSAGSPDVTLSTYQQTSFGLDGIQEIIPHRLTLDLDFTKAFQTTVNGVTGSTTFNDATAQFIWSLALTAKF